MNRTKALATLAVFLLIEGVLLAEPFAIAISSSSLKKRADVSVITGAEWDNVIDHLRDQRKTASYIIYQDGSTIKALNGTTGAVDYSGSTASTVIQSALTAMPSGGKLFFKRGTYSASSNIKVYFPDNTTIEGEDKWGVIFRRILFSPVQSPARTRQVTFRSLTVDLVDRQSPAFDLLQSDRVLLDSVVAMNANYGVYNHVFSGEVTNPSQTIITNSHFSNNLYGIFLTGPEQRGAVITNSHFLNNSNGIRLEDRVGDVHISNIVVKGQGSIADSNNNDGIIISDADRVTIEGSSIYNNGRNGITVSDGASEVSIHDNVIFFNGRRIAAAGISFATGEVYRREDVHDNILLNNQDYGIRVGTTSTALEIYDSRFVGNIARNVAVGELGNNITVVGDEQDYGMLYNRTSSGDFNVIIANDFRGNNLGAITFGATGSGTNDEVSKNIGYVTENTATFTSINNGTWVSHGLASTPQTVIVTLTTQGYAWVGGTNSTKVRLYFNTATASGSFYAEYKP